MASLRSSWSGSMGFGMVNIPVKLYNTVGDVSGRDRVHQYHKDDMGRIKQLKTCSICGTGLDETNIIKGYELTKETAIPLTDEDLAYLPLASMGAMAILGFVESFEMADIRLGDGCYYIAAEGKGSAKAFSLLNKTMQNLNVVGITKVAFKSSKEHLAVIHPDVQNGVMLLQTIHWIQELKPQGDLGVRVEVSEKELALGEMLVGNMRQKVLLSEYQDEYAAALQKLVEAKQSGQILAVPAAPKTTGEDDLIASLMASIQMAPAAK
jgi:DNA end-binding protein Ku